MLNIPQDHPARDMWDTLWVEKDDHINSEPLLLRTHTSPMQARIMEASSPPIRVIIPGKCYRYEATDATHEWQLTQIEGLAVDADISFADLKGTLYEFAKRIFGKNFIEIFFDKTFLIKKENSFNIFCVKLFLVNSLVAIVLIVTASVCIPAFPPIEATIGINTASATTFSIEA